MFQQKNKTLAQRLHEPNHHVTGTRRPLQATDKNAAVNPFSKTTLSGKLTQAGTNDEFKLPSIAESSPKKSSESNVLSAEPGGGITKVTKPSAAVKYHFATALKTKDRERKAKQGNKLAAALQPRTSKFTRQGKARKPRQKRPRSKRKPEHPLFSAFKEATLAFKTHIESEGPRGLAEAVDAISTRLDAVDAASSAALESHAESIAILTKPFKDEALLLTRQQSEQKQERQVTIGERVGAFARLLKAKEESMADLWTQWGGVMAQIEKLGAGLASAEDELEPNSYAAQARKLQEDYRSKREQVLKTFEQESAKLERKAEASEKVRVIDVRAKETRMLTSTQKYEAEIARQRQALMQYMQLEAEIRGSSDEEDDDDDGEIVAGN